MRETIIQKYINKKTTAKDAAKDLSLHEKSFLRLVGRYKRYGPDALVWKKSGPKGGSPDNRTPEWLEKRLEDLAEKHRDIGPIRLASKLEESTGVLLNQSTIYRILKRRGVRYTKTYKRWKAEPKLYCLDAPGDELQLDASFPFGRYRKVVSIDAIDDCSRMVYAELYDGATIDNAILFVDRLIQRFPGRITAIRTDNGFDTKKFRDHLAGYGIELRVNPPYTPEHNGKIERYHKTMKREFFWKYIRADEEFESIRYKYQLWLHEYNFKRKHTGLGMNSRTPAEKLVSAYLDAHALVIPIMRKEGFYPSQKEFVVVTGILQQYIFCTAKKNMR